jgi:hypothetical protein
VQEKVIFSSKEQATLTDMNNLGQFPRDTFDAILEDLGPGKTFTGFPVVASSAFQVTVGNGRLYMPDGTMYFNGTETGEVVDLLPNAPLVTQKYVAIAVWGTQAESTPEPRAFLVNATDRTTTSRVVTTISERHANIGAVPGVEAPSPTTPGVAANYVVVAYVLLSTTGIVSITVPTDFRAQSLSLHTSRLNGFDAWRTLAGTKLDTLATDIAGLASRIGGLAPMGMVLNLAVDVAQLAEKAGLPSTYSDWASDHYLTTTWSDLTHVDYLAKVEEGVRFPDAAQRVAQVGLQNPIDATVNVQAGFMLPAYDDSIRLSSVGRDAEISVSQYQTQTISWVLLTKTRARIRYGVPFTVCSNGVWWFNPTGNEQPWNNLGGGVGGVTPNVDLIYDPIRNIFTRQSTGETFQLLGLTEPGADPSGAYAWMRLVQFWVDEIPDVQYWDRIVTTDGLNGSVISQSFLNSQGGWLTGIDLYFTRVATAGDVTVLVCECDNTGVPRTDRVLGTSTLTVANLHPATGVGAGDIVATTFPFVPIYLKRGARFGFAIQTNGNHYIAETVNNHFAQGSRFQMTDGAFQMGDPTHDLAFQLHFARFRQTRLEVQLLPLQLDGGIAAIDINVDSVRPGACQIEYQLQINGVWTPMGGSDISVGGLVGLPAMLLFRVVFTGTVDEMPGIGVLSNSQIMTSRPRSDYRHISTARLPQVAVTSVRVTVRLEYWRGAPHHVHTLELLTGAGYTTLRTPATVTDVVAPDDPQNAIIRTYVFTGLPSITAFKIRQEGTTDNVVAVYHVADRVDVDLA